MDEENIGMQWGKVADLSRFAAVGKRRMASSLLPSFPLPFNWRSIFHNRLVTVSTCKVHDSRCMRALKSGCLKPEQAHQEHPFACS